MLARRDFLKDRDLNRIRRDAGPVLEKGDEKPWPTWTAAAAVLCLKMLKRGREGPAVVLGLNKNTPTRDRIIKELTARPTLRA